MEREQNHRQKPSVEIYGTFGPSCHTRQDLQAMLESGMSGIRLNLSHSSLMEHEDWIENLHAACQETGKACSLVIDLQGRERRLGCFEPFSIQCGDLLPVSESFSFPEDVLAFLEPGQTVHIGDGNLELVLKTKKRAEDGSLQAVFEAGTDGLLEPRKAIHTQIEHFNLPVCSEEDLKNLEEGNRLGVGGVLVPFVESADDLRSIRSLLEDLLPGCRILAKIESLEGVRNLESILPWCDLLVIARGDLGAACGLEWLPALQDWIESCCHAHHTPYLVVTQMLESMRQAPAPTRPEVSDIYHAVLGGAAAVMLTGETASSAYPLQAMQWMARMVQTALDVRHHPDTALNWILKPEKA